MNKKMCNDRVPYDPSFAVHNVIQPLARAKGPGYPENIAEAGDVCYYTTPNLVGKKMYCANPAKPQHTMKAETR